MDRIYEPFYPTGVRPTINRNQRSKKAKWERRLLTSFCCLFLGIGLLCGSIFFEKFSLLFLLGSLLLFISGIVLSWLVNRELDMLHFKPGTHENDP